MKLSKRENKLLFLLLLVGILAVGLKGLILPAQQRQILLKEELSTQQMAKSLAELTLTDGATIEEQLKESQVITDALHQVIPTDTDNYKIEQNLTGLGVQAGLTPQSFSILVTSKEEEEKMLEQFEQNAENGPALQEGYETAKEHLKVVEIVMELTGTRDQALAFRNLVNSGSNRYVLSYRYVLDRGTNREMNTFNIVALFDAAEEDR